MRPVALLLALLLVAPACGRKKKPPLPTTQPVVEAPAGPAKVKAPPGVPQALKDLVQSEWSGIEKEGDLFVASFKEAQAAKEKDDRSAMDVAIAEANKHYKAACDAWAVIAYWPDNELGDGKIDEATAEVCRKWLDSYNKKVEDWTKKNKGLVQFSRNK